MEELMGILIKERVSCGVNLKKKIKQQKKNLCGTPIVLFKNFFKRWNSGE